MRFSEKVSSVSKNKQVQWMSQSILVHSHARAVAWSGDFVGYSRNGRNGPVATWAVTLGVWKTTCSRKSQGLIQGNRYFYFFSSETLSSVSYYCDMNNPYCFVWYCSQICTALYTHTTLQNSFLLRSLSAKNYPLTLYWSRQHWCGGTFGQPEIPRSFHGTKTI